MGRAIREYTLPGESTKGQYHQPHKDFPMVVKVLHPHFTPQNYHHTTRCHSCLHLQAADVLIDSVGHGLMPLFHRERLKAISVVAARVLHDPVPRLPMC